MERVQSSIWNPAVFETIQGVFLNARTFISELRAFVIVHFLLKPDDISLMVRKRGQE